jgi:hypothetical protein
MRDIGILLTLPVEHLLRLVEQDRMPQSVAVMTLRFPVVEDSRQHRLDHKLLHLPHWLLQFKDYVPVQQLLDRIATGHLSEELGSDIQNKFVLRRSVVVPCH